MTTCNCLSICLLLGTFPDVSESNCAFCAGHSFNVRRLIDHQSTGKKFEGKGTATSAQYVAYCSCKKDNENLGWHTDPTIEPGCVHAVCKVIGFTRPGREGYAVDWDFGEIVQVKPPIPLPEGVGRGAAFFPLRNPHLQEPFASLVQFLQSGSARARTDTCA